MKMLSPNFEVVVGTYEEYLLGYKLCASNTKKNNIELTQSFATHAHTGSIRCVCSSGRYLASGGADDRLIIYDMIERKEHCMLNHHNATVNCVQFTVNNSHVISSSTDGVISIVRCGNWQLEKLWSKPHQGSSVLDIAVHPTGKLALTLGSDSTLRTWNLIKGRQAYVINLNSKSTHAKSLDFVQWGPCGEKFILAGGHNIEFWSINTGAIINKQQYTSKISSVCWLTQNQIAIGHENGQITISNLETNDQNQFTAHTLRVKCIQSHDNWLVTASSDGHIKIWSVDDDFKCTEMGGCNTGCRCTSLTLVLPHQFKNEKIDSDSKSSETIAESSSNHSEQHVSQIRSTATNTFQNDQGCKVIIEKEHDISIMSKKRKYYKKQKFNQKSNKKIQS